MRPFTTLTGIAIPFGRAHVDTDIIIPARWLKHVSKTGLAEGAFEALRTEPDNLFDTPRNKGAPILIAGPNFGCGSSREHACWALADIGLRCIIAPNFADIFAGNAVKNGILLVALPPHQVERLMQAAGDTPLTVDLPTQEVRIEGGASFGFDIDPFRRHCLLEGLDEIDLTLAQVEDIAAFARTRAAALPWAASPATVSQGLSSNPQSNPPTDAC